MKSIRNWDDLEPYGIEMLTGEACAYGYRILCDVTPEGAKLVQDCFGVHGDPWPLNAPWNTRGSASLMLPLQMFEPLAVFALIGANAPEVVITKDAVYGLEPTDDLEQYARFVRGHQESGTLKRVVRNPGYSRNRHAFTGRTV